MWYRRQLLRTAGIAAAAIGALGVSAATASADTMPFNTTVNGALQITGAGPNGPTSAFYSGTGMGVGLGGAKMQGNITVTGPGPAPACANGFTATHSDTLTSSSGAQLYVAIAETSCPEPANPSIFDCAGSYTVTGGTGRFALATGSGTWSGKLQFTSPSGGVFTASYTGVLSLPGNS